MLTPVGIEAGNIMVTVDGTIVTNLIYSGPATSLAVVFPGLTLNQPHTVTVAGTDHSGRVASATANFDTFNPNSYTFEAEDFDYNGGQFFDNPQTGAYTGLNGVVWIDCYRTNPAGESGVPSKPAGAGNRKSFRTNRVWLLVPACKITTSGSTTAVIGGIIREHSRRGPIISICARPTASGLQETAPVCQC